MRKTLIVTGIVLLSPLWLYLGYIVLFGGTWWLLGYEQGLAPWKLAEKLAQERRPAKDCFLFRTTDIGPRPTTYEMQMSCVDEYAKLTKDPSACELLLPGEYGQDCLGTIASLINTGSGCSSYASGEILCASGVEGKKSGVEDCKKYHEKDLLFWCYIERSRTLDGVNDCQKISDEDPLVKDECSRWYAYKKKDSSLCSLVRNDNLRKICELQIKYAR